MSDLGCQISIKSAELLIAANGRFDGMVSSEQYQKIANELLKLFDNLTLPTEEISEWSKNPPTEPGWYWWRDNGSAAVPVYAGDGPFGNTAFKPGKGWVLANKMGGKWWSERIEPPNEQGESGE